MATCVFISMIYVNWVFSHAKKIHYYLAEAGSTVGENWAAGEKANRSWIWTHCDCIGEKLLCHSTVLAGWPICPDTRFIYSTICQNVAEPSPGLDPLPHRIIKCYHRLLHTPSFLKQSTIICFQVSQPKPASGKSYLNNSRRRMSDLVVTLKFWTTLRL